MGFPSKGPVQSQSQLRMASLLGESNDMGLALGEERPGILSDY
jgi:hypothetical protein